VTGDLHLRLLRLWLARDKHIVVYGDRASIRHRGFLEKEYAAMRQMRWLP
jgi:hypothetical protein